MTDWSKDERSTLGRLQQKIRDAQHENKAKEGYYRGETPVKNLGIAVPENLIGVAPILGWPSTVVDSVAERVDFLGFSSRGDHAQVLDEAARISRLTQEFAKAVTDSLIYGVGFLEFLWEDRPGGGLRPVVTAVDPMSATFEWDRKGKTVESGLVTRHSAKGKTIRTLHTPNSTVWEEPQDFGPPKVRRYDHGWGIAGLVPILNRVRSGKARGHSEITPAIRYATDHGVRTMLGLEYNREIYTAPKRHVEDAYPETVGMSEDADPRANRRAAWNASMSSYTVFPPTEIEDEDGEIRYVSPKVGQFSASPPDPYISELTMLTKVIAAESGIPVEYLGFLTDNPSSADAIRQKEARLVKRAELKHRQLAEVLTRMVAPLLWRITLGYPMPDELRADLDALFRNAATPTQAAMADAGQKWVAAKMMPPRSSVLYDLMGLTPEQQRRLEADWARDTSRALVGDLQARAQEARDSSSTVDTLSSTTEEADWGDTG